MRKLPHEFASLDQKQRVFLQNGTQPPPEPLFHAQLTHGSKPTRATAATLAAAGLLQPTKSRASRYTPAPPLRLLCLHAGPPTLTATPRDTIPSTRSTTDAYATAIAHAPNSCEAPRSKSCTLYTVPHPQTKGNGGANRRRIPWSTYVTNTP